MGAPRVILVSGKGGVGKTTFCLYGMNVDMVALERCRAVCQPAVSGF